MYTLEPPNDSELQWWFTSTVQVPAKGERPAAHTEYRQTTQPHIFVAADETLTTIIAEATDQKTGDMFMATYACTSVLNWLYRIVGMARANMP